MTIEARLEEAGLIVPEAAAPAANYVPYVLDGKYVHISGQLPFQDGTLLSTGRVGETVDIAQATRAAQACALNIIAQIKAACAGDLDRVDQVLKLGAFVACVDGFEDQPLVVNGASDVMVLAFGDRGRHARFAVGTNALPLGASVEIDALVKLKSGDRE